MKRSSRIVLCALLAAAMGAPIALRARGQAAAPTAIAAPAARTPQQIVGDLQAEGAKLEQAMDGGAALKTADARKKAAPIVNAQAPKMIALLNELAAADPRAKDMASTNIAKLQVLQIAVGEPGVTAENAKTAASTGPAANQAKAIRAAADYIVGIGNVDAQNKAADDFDVVLKLAKDDQVVLLLLGYLFEMEPAGPAVSQHVVKIARADAGAVGDQMATQFEARQKQVAMDGKPFELKGDKFGGGAFTTADWKGKVVLIDFWATWCQPCLMELPKVKKLYADYHDKGLEIVGVSCDNSGDDLKNFLGMNKDMPWPQLFNPAKPGWNALAMDNGVIAIPTTFLIDRAGVLHLMDPGDDLDKSVEKLLAEKAP